RRAVVAGEAAPHTRPPLNETRNGGADVGADPRVIRRLCGVEVDDAAGLDHLAVRDVFAPNLDRATSEGARSAPEQPLELRRRTVRGPFVAPRLRMVDMQ